MAGRPDHPLHQPQGRRAAGDGALEIEPHGPLLLVGRGARDGVAQHDDVADLHSVEARRGVPEEVRRLQARRAVQRRQLEVGGLEVGDLGAPADQARLVQGHCIVGREVRNRHRRQRQALGRVDADGDPELGGRRGAVQPGLALHVQQGGRAALGRRRGLDLIGFDPGREAAVDDARNLAARRPHGGLGERARRRRGRADCSHQRQSADHRRAQPPHSPSDAARRISPPAGPPARPRRPDHWPSLLSA